MYAAHRYRQLSGEETVSRLFTRFQRKGILTVNRRFIESFDLHKLQIAAADETAQISVKKISAKKISAEKVFSEKASAEKASAENKMTAKSAHIKPVHMLPRTPQSIA